MKKILALSIALMAGAASAVVFRVTPYVQHPSPTAMTLKFISDADVTATVSWWPEGKPEAAQSAVVSPRQATELGYFGATHALQYLPAMDPWQYRHRIEGLEPDAVYGYKVTLAGGPSYENTFRTVPVRNRAVRFVAYADCETQPSSTGDCERWEDFAVDRDEDTATALNCTRRYFVDQTVGFASNVCTMAARKPDFIVVAGDLAQKGSDQTHWDEYWRHNAGELNDIAGSTPIVPAIGNHDYHDYYTDAGERGARKFLSYFELEPNGAAVDADQQQRFHRLDYGPVALIYLDLNNGLDGQADKDTNVYLSQKTCRAPDFNEGSEQYRWLEQQLADTQKKKAFTFLVSHQCPYSVGHHGRVNGDKGRVPSTAEDLSGVPTRCLMKLAKQYGVAAWICGHDEIYEHSLVDGIHVYDVGIGGDGLRGCKRTTENNPYEVFRAHVDAPEVYDATGTLVSGGKHYGHLEVNVEPKGKDVWTATLTPVHVFVSSNTVTHALSFERRAYADEVVLTNRLSASGGFLCVFR